VNAQKPFTADLENDVWTVKGTLPAGEVGLTLIARLSKTDGRIFGLEVA
jgi:hypothetical protein